MADVVITPWVDAGDPNGLKYSMNRFQCDGTANVFSINYAGVAPGYLDRQYIKYYTINADTLVKSDIAVVPSNAWQTDSTIKLEQSPGVPYPAGLWMVIYRDTPKDMPLVDFSDGSVINEENLDTGFRQSIYVVAEMVDRFEETLQSNADVIDMANEAITTANSALSASSAAQTASTNAVNTANAAQTAAGNAVTTANAAAATANGIDGKAQTALDNSVAAVAAANNAVTTANGIDAKASTALTNSTNAVNTANAASTTAGTANTNATTALNTANAIDAKATAALATAGPFRDTAVMLFGVRGSTDPNANWSPAPTSAGSGTRFRLKVASGLLPRPGSINGPLTLTNFDEELVIATVGPNGQDGSILNDATNRVSKVFIIYGEAVAPKLVVTANATPNLASPLFTGYTYYQFICIGDTTGLVWNWAFKLTGCKQIYFSRRDIAATASLESSTLYASIFYPGQEGVIVDFDVETFLSISAAAGGYGEMSMTISGESGNSTALQGSLGVARALAYGTSIPTTAYGTARVTVAYPTGGNIKVFSSAVSGSVIAASMYTAVYGFTVANCAVN